MPMKCIFMRKAVLQTSLCERIKNDLFQYTLYFTEKAVVYNFMDNLSKATSNPVPIRPTTPKPEEKISAKPQFSKELYFKQRAKSARSQRVTERPSLPPRPKSVGSMRYLQHLFSSLIEVTSLCTIVKCIPEYCSVVVSVTNEYWT